MKLYLVAPLTLVASMLVFTVFCLVLRRIHFSDSSDVSPDRLEGDRAERVQNSRDQSDRVHRVFEFYLKLTLAILGGVAYLVSNTKPGHSAATAELLAAAGQLELMIGIAFSVLVCIHMRSKIFRWPRRFAWWEPFLWMECWFIAVMMTIATCLWFVVVQNISTVLPN